MNSLFNRLIKYNPNRDTTPSENFITEAFVYLLEYSLIARTDFLKMFCSFLGITITQNDYEVTSIDTQRYYSTIYDIQAVPDISLQVKTQLILIEVKIDSSINSYQIPKRPYHINQIEKYQGIKTSCNKLIYTLVKYPSHGEFSNTCPDFQKEVYWYDIYNLITKYCPDDIVDSFLCKELIKFMEEIKMAAPKVTYELQAGMQALNNLFLQIENSLDDLKIPSNRSFGYNWTGYYLFENDKKIDKNYGFIGTYWDPEKLTFIYIDEKAQLEIRNKSIESDFQSHPHEKKFCKYFVFENEHYFCLNADEQLRKLKKWIEENYNLLKNLTA